MKIIENKIVENGKFSAFNSGLPRSSFLTARNDGSSVVGKVTNCKFAIFLLCMLLLMSCNLRSDRPIDILQPNFNLTLGKLLKDSFCFRPEGAHCILSKQVGDTLLYYQFDDDNCNRKSKPRYMFCQFPISNDNTIEDIESLFWDRMYFVMCEGEKNDLLEIFYIKHQLKGYIFCCTINRVNNTLTLSYHYPQIDN